VGSELPRLGKPHTRSEGLNQVRTAGAAYLCRGRVASPRPSFRGGSSGRFLAASTAAGVKVERPTGRTTLTPAGATPACPPPEERWSVSSSSRLSTPWRRSGWGGAGRGAQAYLGARTMVRSTRWWMGCDPLRAAAARSMQVVHDQVVATVAWRELAATSVVITGACGTKPPFYAAADVTSGWGRSTSSGSSVTSTAASASSPSSARVKRIRRASLRATERPGRLPPTRSLSWW
jgi:hypothetical protein